MKSALCLAFKARPEMERAYLCRVRFDEAGSDTIGLAISAPEDATLADQVGKIFWQLFARGVSLDIMLVGSDMEMRLSRVCTPFYSAG